MSVDTPVERILVLGAGELGMAVLRAVAHRARRSGDVTVSVLLRPAAIVSEDPAKRRDIVELGGLGVGIQSGDVLAAPVAELAEIFARFDTVISCVGFTAGPGTQIKLTRAVLDAGIKRYVPWQFGVDYDLVGRGSPQTLFDEQLDVRALLRAQDRTTWIIIATGMFTSFLFEPAFGVVDVAGRTVRGLGSWDTAVTVTTPEDIGALTAAVLFATPPITDQVVYLAGDTLTYGELADLVADVLGGRINRVLRSAPELAEDLRKDPDDPMRKYRAVFAQGVGVAWGIADTFNGARGIATTTVRQWADVNLKPVQPADHVLTE